MWAVTTNDGTWALGHYERIVDFADRGVHVMAEADKVILKAFYGNLPAHSYFNGCSQGGHEALIEAQRYPDDFDGIIAGDPANNWTRHYAGGHLWSAMAMEGDGLHSGSESAAARGRGEQRMRRARWRERRGAERSPALPLRSR